MYHQIVARTYRKTARAQTERETRERIVKAAIELHQTLGPAFTTVADIAECAGVGRVTVYRHFPDSTDLARACSGEYFARHPLPDPRAWRQHANPSARLRAALELTFAYHRRTAPMMARVLAQTPDHEVMDPYHAHWREVVDTLLRGWDARGRQRHRLRAAITLALRFNTWQLLVQEQGLSDNEAAQLCLTAIQAAAAHHTR